MGDDGDGDAAAIVALQLPVRLVEVGDVGEGGVQAHVGRRDRGVRAHL